MLDILVVDDEVDIQHLFRQYFRRSIRKGEIRFQFATSAEAALKLLREQHPSVVLVLSDINMPGMTGLQLLKTIKTEQPDIRVVMITAYGSDDKRDQALDFGADGYLTKPVDFEEVKTIISNLAQPN